MDLSKIREFLDVNAILTEVVRWVPQLAMGLIILLAFYVLSRLTRRPISAALRSTGMHANLVELLVHKIYHYALSLVGLVMALDQFGINVAAALAGLGVAGIAVGFAAQDTLANLISGIVIFLDRPFIVGDWVTAANQYGQVTEITLRTTRIRTNRNTFVVIPNKNIIDEVLENHSKRGPLRVDVPIGIAYKEDIDEARRVMLEAVSGIDDIMEEKSPDVVAEALGDSSVNLLARVWVEDARHQQPVGFRVVEACKKALDAAGIQIPFPHLQLFVDDVQEPVWKGLASLPAFAGRSGDAPGNGGDDG